MTLETPMRGNHRYVSFYSCNSCASRASWRIPDSLWLSGCDWEVEHFDLSAGNESCEYTRCGRRASYRVTARQYRTHVVQQFFQPVAPPPMPLPAARPEVSNIEAAGAAAYLVGLAGYGLFHAGKAARKRSKKRRK